MQGPSIEQQAQYRKIWGINSPWSSPVATLKTNPWYNSSHLLWSQHPHPGWHLPGHPGGYVVHPVYVSTILLSIRSLLEEPNIHSPLNTHATELWKQKPKQKQKEPITFKKYLQETNSKQVSSQEPWLLPCIVFLAFPYMICPFLYFYMTVILSCVVNFLCDFVF